MPPLKTVKELQRSGEESYAHEIINSDLRSRCALWTPCTPQWNLCRKAGKGSDFWFQGDRADGQRSPVVRRLQDARDAVQ